MGRWWTGYTSISAGRAGIAHSHGEPWRFAAAWRLQPSYGYGLWKTKIPSEKMCCIAAYGGAGCERTGRRARESGGVSVLLAQAVPADLSRPQQNQPTRLCELLSVPAKLSVSECL